MQREIKFRGKRVSDGRWVYGSLINNAFVKSATKTPCIYILPSNLDDFKDECDYYFDCFEDISMWIDYFEVIPETVGQFSGIKDKNGVDIYEGDVIENEARAIYSVNFGFCKKLGFTGWYADGINIQYQSFITNDSDDTKNSLIKIIGNP